MCFGPQPYHMARVRRSSAAIREAKTETVPCLGKVPSEALSISQMPTVKVPSKYDDAVANASLVTDKLKVNVDSVLSKAQELQSSIQGEIGSAISAAEGAIGKAVGEVTALGEKIKGGVQDAVKSAFGSVSDVFPSSRSKDCVALGAPDLEKVDKKAFSGKLGGVASTPQPESDSIDLLEAAVATAAVVGAVEAFAPEPPKLGSSIPPTKVPVVPVVEEVVEEIPSINYGEQPMPDIGLLDGGQF